MRLDLNGSLLALMILTITACASANPTPSTLVPDVFDEIVSSAAPDVLAVFAGTTPCSAEAKPLPQIPAESNCEQMLWKLILRHDPETGAPTTYRLESAFGLPKPNTNDLAGGGTPIVMEGQWTITTGTRTGSQAIVYQLDPENPQTSVSFLKINENLIHVLDSQGRLQVGHGAWSYTLSRMDNQPHTPVNDGTIQVPDPPTRPPLPPTPADLPLVGVFEGRTPCHELVYDVMQIEPFPGCLKIKWRLTLYQDGTYVSMGTSTFRQGTWAISPGFNGDPDAVVYQLNLGDGQTPVFFLGVDENHLFLLDREKSLLVGNELFSYTLSRVDAGSP